MDIEFSSLDVVLISVVASLVVEEVDVATTFVVALAEVTVELVKGDVVNSAVVTCDVVT